MFTSQAAIRIVQHSRAASMSQICFSSAQISHFNDNIHKKSYQCFGSKLIPENSSCTMRQTTIIMGSSMTKLPRLQESYEKQIIPKPISSYQNIGIHQGRPSFYLPHLYALIQAKKQNSTPSTPSTIRLHPSHSILLKLPLNKYYLLLYFGAYKLIEVCCDLLNIQIMSKKPQPQTKENPKNRLQIVDQQNEPFLKTLQKKVRNINKKLTEIAELEAKETLKPEQVEKINRKAALLEERARVEETATLFKETYVENAAVYRNQQLKELEVLSRAIAIFHAGAKLPESDKLANLWHALEQSEHYSTLNDAITALGNSLKDFANDRKLQKALSAYVEEHGNSKITPIVSNEEKIVSDILEEKVEAKPEPVPVQTPAPVVPEPEPTPVVAPVVVAVPEPVPVKVEAPVTEKSEETPVVAVEAVATPLTQAQPAKTEEKPAEQPKEYKKRNYGNRENRDNRDNRENRGGYKRREGEEPREKRQYKPKYAEKEPVAQRQQDDIDSSDSEQEVRNFRKEEIKQLEDDGFIVTKAKPKPKAKDQKEQRQNYENQHGRKPHYNHQK